MLALSGLVLVLKTSRPMPLIPLSNSFIEVNSLWSVTGRFSVTTTWIAHTMFLMHTNTMQLSSTSTLMTLKVASNTNRPDGFNRLGEKAFYAFAYPNFAVERYGPWMTTMHVQPIEQRKCKLVVDYYIENDILNEKDYIDRGIEINDNKEDKVLCESVQRGLETPAYSSGRYVMPIEKGIHHFHCWLHQILK
ncbi:Choline monooxygenase chloroplastic [Bienertia sinuspersici]